MKNWKIANKIIVPSLGIILVFSLTIGWVYQHMKERLYENSREKIRNSVESVHGIVSHFAALEEQGVLTGEEARQAASSALRAVRFDGQNYFWINDLTPRMVMHPTSPELEGKELGEIRDPEGTALFRNMATLAGQKGEGFVSYVWDKPGAQEPVPKVSFVKLVPRWGWVVGGGLYLDDVEAVLANLLKTISAVVLLVITVATALVFWIARSISRPLQRTVTMIDAMGRGELDTRLKLKQKDEIGSLAKSIDAFADTLQDEILTAFHKLSEGDFTFKAQGLIREPLSRANGELNRIMAEIRSAGHQISSGASQVSDASQSLSQGATEQASSLEQISASLGELSSRTQKNAGNAKEAERVVMQVQESAQAGNHQMEGMVRAMGEINAASENISRIIKVIDEIAFQTNLLALNAAVEAARAGAQGKGFAVVAEEVRSLAGRSAKAARETAELIEASVQKASNGVNIADQTASALSEILGGVSKASDLMKEIAAASHEQALGITEINQGLSQIEQVTQQTTANAEETAAVAEELSSQSGLLRQMLDRFVLEEELVGLSRREPSRGPVKQIGHY